MVGNPTDLASGEGSRKTLSLTPRQAEILELAATGLSDKEIARRLHVTHRTVRSHFEKLFHDRGIRNRSEAIAIWSRHQARHSRPPDECPYPKPFPPQFTECPAYQASQMVTVDLLHRPLGPVWTCRHLVSRLIPDTDFHWYGACLVGDADARRRWSHAVGTQRLHDIGTLRQEVSELAGPFVQRLFELKHAPLDSANPPRPGQIEAVVDEFVAEVGTLLNARQAQLDALHLPMAACLRLVQIALDRFLDLGLTEADWEVPDEVLVLFPDDLRSYFQPRLVTEQPGAAATPPELARP